MIGVYQEAVRRAVRTFAQSLGAALVALQFDASSAFVEKVALSAGGAALAASAAFFMNLGGSSEG